MGKKISCSVLLAVLAFLVGAAISNRGVLEYVGGQLNSPLGLFFFFMAFPWGIGAFVLACLVLILRFRRRNRAGKFLTACTIPAWLILGISAGSFCPSIFCEPGAATFLRGFEKWVAKNVDVAAVQKWISENEERWPLPDPLKALSYGVRDEKLPSFL